MRSCSRARYAAARYSAQVGAPACATRVIPNGLAPEEFAQAEPAPDAADFLFVGELRHLKGVDVLLRALAQVRARRIGERGHRRRGTRTRRSSSARRPSSVSTAS